MDDEAPRPCGILTGTAGQRKCRSAQDDGGRVESSLALRADSRVAPLTPSPCPAGILRSTQDDKIWLLIPT
jgi:hypothetical protein